MLVLKVIDGVTKVTEFVDDLNTNFADLDNLKADKNNVLQLDNTINYTPSKDFHPATKKYVDTKTGEILTNLPIATTYSLSVEGALGIAKFDSTYFEVTDGAVTLVEGSAGTYDHSKLSNLGYDNSGHTGFQKSITTGAVSQYFDGTLALQTFPTKLSDFTNDLGTFLTENQTITLSGDASGSGKTAIITSVDKLQGFTVEKTADGLTLLFHGNFATTGELQAWSDDGTGLPASLLDSLPIASYNQLGIASFDNTDFTVTNGAVSLISANITPIWGNINGSLSDQTDLSAALSGKVDINAPINAATYTKVSYDTKGLITGGADATTNDIADSTDKRYVTDLQRSILQILDDFGWSIPTTGTLLFDGNFAATGEIQAWSDDGTGLPQSLLDALPIASTTPNPDDKSALGIASFNPSNFAVDSNGSVSLVSGSGGGMVYPSAGIALSDGVSWLGSITNNSNNWNTAYLHSQITSGNPHQISFSDLVGTNPTTLEGYGITDVAGVYSRSARVLQYISDAIDNGDDIESITALDENFSDVSNKGAAVFDTYSFDVTNGVVSLPIDLKILRSIETKEYKNLPIAQYFVRDSQIQEYVSDGMSDNDSFEALAYLDSEFATNYKKGVATFNERDFDVYDGFVNLKPELSILKSLGIAVSKAEDGYVLDVNGDIIIRGNIIATKEIQAWTDDGTGLPQSLLDALPIAGYDTTLARGIASFNSNYFDVVDGVVSFKSGTVGITDKNYGDVIVSNSGQTWTVVDDSHNHVISNVDGLQSALDNKVDDGQVLTNVPVGAVFTDTVTRLSNDGITFSAGDFTIKAKSGSLVSVSLLSGVFEIDTGANNYSLSVATSSDLGGIKIGYSASGANIPITLSSEQALVTLTDTAIRTGLTAGVTTQYFRGDKSWQTLNTDAVATTATRDYVTPEQLTNLINILDNFTWSDISSTGNPVLKFTGSFVATGDIQAWTNDSTLPPTFWDALPIASTTPNPDDKSALGIASFDPLSFAVDANGAVTFIGSGASGGTLDHSKLNNLDYNSSGHTGFEPTITVLPISRGGTGLTSISTLLNSNVTPTSLGLVIGTDVLAYRTFGSAANNATTDFLAYNGTAVDSAKLGGQLPSYYTDIPARLGYTPYNSTNPNNYIALTDLSSTTIGLTYTNTTGVFSLTSGYVIPTITEETNWSTAYTERHQWDGGNTNLVAATGRASLGATTVGSNLFTLINPSANTFIQINYDNTITTISGTTLRSAISAQPQLNGTGVVKMNGTIVSYDNTSYLPVASYTSTDILTKLKTVDGSGSGLDADLLDGYHWDEIPTKFQAGVYSRSAVIEQYINDAITNGDTIEGLSSLDNNFSDVSNKGIAVFNAKDFLVTNGVVSLATKLNLVSKLSVGYNTEQSYMLAVNGDGYFAGNVTATGAMLGATSLSLSATLGDKVSLYDNRIGVANMYGFGVEGSSLYSRSYSYFRWYVNHLADGTSYKMQLDSSGNLTVLGNATATGEVTAFTSSDIRLKTNVNTINNASAFLNQFNPVHFNWNEKMKALNQAKDDRLSYGLIAQEVQSVAPEFVHSIYTDYLAVDYLSFVPVLISAEQEHEQRILQLESRVKYLEMELKRYKL
jgi:hypothetical protein